MTFCSCLLLVRALSTSSMTKKLIEPPCQAMMHVRTLPAMLMQVALPLTCAVEWSNFTVL